MSTTILHPSVIWEPGNSTRYEIVVTPMPERAFSFSKGSVLVTGPFSDKLRVMAVDPEGGLHWTYVGEKMGLNEVDASCVTRMIGYALGLNPKHVYITEDEDILSRMTRTLPTATR